MVIALPLPRAGRFRLGDLGEEDILRLLHNYARDGVAHTEVAEVEQRQHTASDEDHIAGQTNPLQEGVSLVGQELQRAGLIVTYAHRLVEGGATTFSIDAAPTASQRLVPA